MSPAAPAAGVLTYRWVWDLGAGREALWPLLADTNRFNREVGLPPVEADPAPGPDPGPGGRRLRLFRLGLPIEWDETPFEWVWPERFGVLRRYRRGPVAELKVRVHLAERPEGGTRVTYEVAARPRGVLGRLAIPIEIGVRCARAFERVVRGYDRMASLAGRGAALRPVAGPVSLAPGAAGRLASGRAALLAQAAPAGLVDKLEATLTQADDLAVSRLRPYALADQWGAGRRDVLELCLRATRTGWLDLRWELLCPLCRGPKSSLEHLADLPGEVHCEACHIDVAVDFDRLVEATFRPNPAIRAAEERGYCLGGPQVTPHVVAQQRLGPGESRSVALALAPGGHRLRVLGRPGGRLVRVAPDGPDGARVRVSPHGWPRDELALGPRPAVTLENETAEEQVVLLERMAWSDQAVTAAELSTLQLFRDLFATEALRPGTRLAVQSLTLAFTDVAGSTRLYREIGDAPAFGRILGHFETVRAAIDGEGGAVVKTMGDAVMAAFVRPASALRAMLRAQESLARPAAGQPALALKAGIHAGPCLAVTLNGRLDYFGSVVNAAARLEALSSGEDVVVSAEVRRDPEVARLIDDGTGLSAEPFETGLRGFDQTRFTLFRVRAAASPGPSLTEGRPLD